MVYDPVVFSERTGWDRTPNPLAEAEAEVRQRFDIIDLTVSNPTQVGLPFNEKALAKIIKQSTRHMYEPAALGTSSARVAVAEYYSRRGVDVDPDRVVITATTSEAYTFVFRILADPQDRILTAQPSYPLFSFLAESASLDLDYHALEYQDRWTLNFDALEAQLSDRTRGLLIVSPNNPTGSCLSFVERRRLIALARARSLPLIADEVFLDYLDTPEHFSRHCFARTDEVLCFTLSGLSKVAGLPQMKLSWMVLSGPDDEINEARQRLEIVADTFLSVATPVQTGLPQLLELAETFQSHLRDRILDNLVTLRSTLPKEARVRTRDGGWYALVDLPPHQDDQSWALTLLKRDRVLVQPGYLYDGPESSMVVSLIVPPDTFQTGLSLVSSRIQRGG